MQFALREIDVIAAFNPRVKKRSIVTSFFILLVGQITEQVSTTQPKKNKVTK